LLALGDGAKGAVSVQGCICILQRPKGRMNGLKMMTGIQGPSGIMGTKITVYLL
jgi:hypothetical protein